MLRRLLDLLARYVRGLVLTTPLRPDNVPIENADSYQIYHKICLKCQQCGKRLDPGSLVEHDSEVSFKTFDLGLD